LQALLSALAILQATFDGNYLPADLFEMAAACELHLCRTHSFVHENKGTALAPALVFRETNGASLNNPCGFSYSAMVKVAAGILGK
jgi:prophage maintenance system killer protein